MLLLIMDSALYRQLTSSSAVTKRPHDASGLSVCFVASIMQYLECNFLLLVTSASDLLVRKIRFHSVVFGVMSSRAIIRTIHCPPWLCIVRERACSVLRCRTTATLTSYRAWWLNTCIPVRGVPIGILP